MEMDQKIGYKYGPTGLALNLGNCKDLTMTPPKNDSLSGVAPNQFVQGNQCHLSRSIFLGGQQISEHVHTVRFVAT